MVCENRRMSFLMGKLLELQRQQRRFELLVREAPSLSLPSAGLGRIAELLRQTPGDGLSGLLRSPSAPEVPNALVEVTAKQLLAGASGLQALAAYPLDSPKMLDAAKAHDVDERILREVHEQLDQQQRR